jgi:trigger factor
MDGIASVHEFTVPQALVQREIQVLKDQMMSQFQLPQGGDQTNLPSLPDELFHDQAQKRVLVGLAVNEVISAHEMVADEAVVDARLAEIAAGYGEAEQVINWYKSNPEQLRNIEMGILEDRVVDHILSQSSVTDVACDYKDAISGKAIAPEPELEAEAVDNAIEATDSPDTDDAQKDVEKQDE